MRAMPLTPTIRRTVYRMTSVDNLGQDEVADARQETQPQQAAFHADGLIAAAAIDDDIYFLKRPFDVAAALVLSIASLPIVLVLALTSAITLRAWPFFLQERVGADSQPFRLIKIRSLPRSAPAYADREELADDHVGRWGGFIRSRHLDEIPQFWQVLSGKMSLVGPRPMISSIVDRMHPHHERHRHSVRPGVTGLWQISEAGSRLVLEASEYDAHYVEVAGPCLDFWILWVTAKQAFGTKPLRRDQLPHWVQVYPVAAPTTDG